MTAAEMHTVTTMRAVTAAESSFTEVSPKRLVRADALLAASIARKELAVDRGHRVVQITHITAANTRRSKL